MIKVSEITNEEMETCLKVLRTVRNAYLGPKTFGAEEAVILFHAHRVIIEVVQQREKVES